MIADSGRRLIDALAEQLDLACEKLNGVRSDSPAWKVLPHLVAQPVVNTRYLREDIGMSKPQAEQASNSENWESWRPDRANSAMCFGNIAGSLTCWMGIRRVCGVDDLTQGGLEDVATTGFFGT